MSTIGFRRRKVSANRSGGKNLTAGGINVFVGGSSNTNSKTNPNCLPLHFAENCERFIATRTSAFRILLSPTSSSFSTWPPSPMWTMALTVPDFPAPAARSPLVGSSSDSTQEKSLGAIRVCPESGTVNAIPEKRSNRPILVTELVLLLLTRISSKSGRCYASVRLYFDRPGRNPLL